MTSYKLYENGEKYDRKRGLKTKFILLKLQYNKSSGCIGGEQNDRNW